jgi:hypothetical protein
MKCEFRNTVKGKKKKESEVLNFDFSKKVLQKVSKIIGRPRY